MDSPWPCCLWDFFVSFFPSIAPTGRNRSIPPEILFAYFMKTLLSSPMTEILPEEKVARFFLAGYIYMSCFAVFILILFLFKVTNLQFVNTSMFLVRTFLTFSLSKGEGWFRSINQSINPANSEIYSFFYYAIFTRQFLLP